MATQPSTITVEEYLAGEERSALRHEYCNGHIIAMAGGTPTQADIISNLNAIIKAQIRHSGCYVRSTDQRVRTAQDGLYTYPDLVILRHLRYRTVSFFRLREYMQAVSAHHGLTRIPFLRESLDW